MAPPALTVSMLLLSLVFAAAQVPQSVPAYGALSSSSRQFALSSLDGFDAGNSAYSNSSKAANYTDVQLLYVTGRHVPRSSSSNFAAKDLLEGSYAGTPSLALSSSYYNASTPFGNFLGSAVNGTGPFNASAPGYCCAKRLETVRAGFRAYTFQWSLAQIDEAYKLALAPNRNLAAINNTVDRAVAIWWGTPEAGSYAPSVMANGYSSRSCTNTTAVPGVNATNAARFLTAAKSFREAAVRGQRASMDMYRNYMTRASMATLVQAFLYNAGEAADPPTDSYMARGVITPCINECGLGATKQAAALQYWRVLAPYLAVKAPAETKAMLDALTRTQLDVPAWERLQPQVKAAASKSGIQWDRAVNGCPIDLGSVSLG